METDKWSPPVRQLVSLPVIFCSCSVPRPDSISSASAVWELAMGNLKLCDVHERLSPEMPSLGEMNPCWLTLKWDTLWFKLVTILYHYRHSHLGTNLNISSLRHIYMYETWETHYFDRKVSHLRGNAASASYQDMLVWRIFPLAHFFPFHSHPE